MTKTGQAALIYGVAFLGAAGLSAWRGRSGRELLVDTVTYGAIAGTGLVVANELTGDPVAVALPNVGFFHGMGAMGSQAVKLLSNLDTDKLYAEMKKNGVTVGPVPANPHIVNQDRT